MNWETDRGLLLGDGLFETLRVEEGRPLLLGRHLARLGRSAQRMALPLDLQGIEDRARREASCLPDGPHTLRITITRGPGPRGLMPPVEPEPRVLVTTAQAGARTPGPLTLAVAEVRRNAGSPTSSMKTLGYLDNVLARMEVEGHADDALMLNTDDLPACTTIGNLLVRTRGGWVTPPAVIGGVLPGVVRDVLLEAGAIREASVSLADCRGYPLARCNSLVGVQAMVLHGGVSADVDAARELTQVLAAAERREP